MGAREILSRVGGGETESLQVTVHEQVRRGAGVCELVGGESAEGGPLMPAFFGVQCLPISGTAH